MTSQDFSSFFDPSLLEETETGRRGLFESFLPDFLNPTQQGRASSLFQPTFNRFLGQLGEQFRQGQTPDLSFNDFLNQSFDPTRELLKFNDQSRFSPTIFR